ncbi:MAG: glycosyltransferase family 39 protein [Candidatus Levybacteria bacterium]|nr:glycosyltransferase family 39 protein [Candidatus Levybacteria bacterium]
MIKSWHIKQINYVLVVILALGFILRLYDLNWDQGFHLHPDERAITLFTVPLEMPISIQEFLSVNSPLNPHFFAYGSLPLYLLKLSGTFISNSSLLFAQYEKINLVGRFISAFFDIGTLFIIYLLGKKLFNKYIANLSAFFYAISVLPIQLSHFYAVDTLLNFFIFLTLYLLINFYEKSTIRNALITGAAFGFALGTKISATVILASIGFALAIDFILIFLKNLHHPKIWFPHIPKFIKTLILKGVVVAISAIVVFIIVEPYALIDFREFWQQTIQQRQMTYDAFTFPYTLQYVGKIPYFYELKNIFLWGQGPILAIVSFVGALYFTIVAIRKEKKTKWAQELILVVFFWTYFFVVGKFAVGWMRYMLPLYPLFSLFAAVLVWKLHSLVKEKLKINPSISIILNSLFIILLLVWPLAFMNIYTKPNTRVLASNWIYQNIPLDKTIAVEHWDDQLPLGGSPYKTITLPLYDPDTFQKWQIINKNLGEIDYIIIASNRLYVPLQKLTDCKKFPPYHCYPITTKYYKDLFNGRLGYEKVAEFENLPTIPLLDIPINDQNADESFTVYDHPKVMIFKKQ